MPYGWYVSTVSCMMYGIATDYSARLTMVQVVHLNRSPWTQGPHNFTEITFIRTKYKKKLRQSTDQYTNRNPNFKYLLLLLIVCTACPATWLPYHQRDVRPPGNLDRGQSFTVWLINFKYVKWWQFCIKSSCNLQLQEQCSCGSAHCSLFIINSEPVFVIEF